ncbi:uncharacterized protein LOC132289551 [Cornus florida]|uniref:uncharacterized protein LOC132289551 n=1 Tax=Cornus florida TaxID=4283 RepID=UPI00289F8FBD|nr:uncharacterized protein LOC132289551 [Cornus florida]
MEATTPITPLRRRNSIATSLVIPSKLTFQTLPHHASSFPTTTTTTTTSSSSASSSSSSQSFPTVDFELISIKPLSYTSLKDVLPSTAVNSPTVQSGYEISIRNRLVKQAAWAYLRPMSISPDSSSRHFLHRLWASISGRLRLKATAFLSLINCHILPTLSRTFDRLLRAIRIPSSR